MLSSLLLTSSIAVNSGSIDRHYTYSCLNECQSCSDIHSDRIYSNMYSDNQCYKNLQLLWKLKADLTAFVNTIQAEIKALVTVTTDNIQSYFVNHYT